MTARHNMDRKRDMTCEEAAEQIVEAIQNDLAYTAPEIQHLIWVSARDRIAQSLNRARKGELE